MHRQHRFGLALAVAAALSFGVGPILAKDVYATGVGWVALLVWRFAIAGGVSWVWLAARPSSRHALASVGWGRAAALLGVGALWAVSAGAYYAAIELVPASLAALTMAVYPALVAVLSIRFGHVAPGPRPWIALALALSGLALVIGGLKTGGDLAGVTLACAAPVIYAFITLIAARIAGERRGTTAVARSGGAGPDTDSAVAGALILTGSTAGGLALVLAAGDPSGSANISAAAWPALLCMGVFAAVAYQAFYAATARIGAAQVALVDTLEPVTTVLLASMLLGEQLAPMQLLGGVVVLSGILLAQAGPSAPAASARGTGPDA